MSVAIPIRNQRPRGSTSQQPAQTVLQETHLPLYLYKQKSPVARQGF
ncbi:hypothetical protein ALQ07_100627 [Pseudomonas syringae pv. actinidiae]|uniref:ABC-type Zn uptake system ZnuABC n=1 Tax=Pseudomonas syringae pv. actinidiae TaxID=103796 RepID=A0A2V0Q551_PSESF|nr:hypothetical protein ALQ07_100627 [Pseudomonas syringae pv. actinidiae]GBH07444.1 ABC-type Zn uptake system ZnuABC [Pseudomonas syringae pv. actinidiae]GBH15195.1 ABC-type Zn uptake system ZnuABC [Pseudomonas syringae pv. actinidiae]